MRPAHLVAERDRFRRYLAARAVPAKVRNLT